jgi:hypothetical protein
MTLVSVLLSAAILAASVVSSGAADRWIAPVAVGKKDGSGPNDAAAPTSVDAQVRAAGPGGRVIFIADRGAYSGVQSLAVRSGGTAGQPVTLTGATSSGNPAVARLVGTGERIFRLYDGANHLVIANFAFEAAGQGAVAVEGDLTGLTVRDSDATRVRKMIEMPGGSSLTDFTFRNLTSSKFSKAFIQLSDASHGLITDLWLDSGWSDGDPLPFGIHADGVTHDVTIRNMTVRNILYSYNGDVNRYWNGDGIATENQTYAITMDNIHVDGSSDAGFDLKGGTAEKPHVVTNSTVTNVKRGLRVWGTVHADNVRIGVLRFPSAIINGKRVTQSSRSGPLASVWMKEGSTLRYRNVTRDGVTLAPTQFDRWDGPSTVTAW